MISPSQQATHKLGVLIRYPVFQDYLDETTPFLLINDAVTFLKEHPYMFWEFQAFIKGRVIKPYPHTEIANSNVLNAFFVDIKKRTVTHKALLHAFQRRDLYFQLDNITELTQYIHPKFKDTWFNKNEASRTYTALISKLSPLPVPIPVESFIVFNTTGHVNKKDPLIHPRVVYVPSSI